MIPASDLALIALAALVMVLTPGLSAARLAAWFAQNPVWLAVQRLVMGFVLSGLAVRLALDPRRN